MRLRWFDSKHKALGLRTLPPLTAGLLCVAVVLAGLAAHMQPWLLRQGELLFYDVSSSAISRSQSPRMALVIVGERSLAALGAWPFPRSRHAALLDQLSLAKVVGLDILFPEPSEDDPLLARSIARHGRVVLASHTAIGADARTGPGMVLPEQVLQDACADVGFTNVDKDADGLIRFGRPIRRLGQEMLPSLGFAMARQALQQEGELEQGGSGYRLRFQDHVVPLDGDGRLWFVPTDQGPPVYEYVDVLQGRVSPAVFRDALVLVGAAASGAADFLIVPEAFGSRVIPGVRFNAEELRALLTGDAVRVPPPWVNPLAAFCLSLACGLALALFRPLRGGLVLCGLCALWLEFAWLMMEGHLVWVAGFTPVAGAVGAGALMLLTRLVSLHESWRAQYISLDSIVFLDPDEARRHQDLGEYLRALWLRVEAETGIRFVAGPLQREELPAEFSDAMASGDGVLVVPSGRRERSMAVPLRSAAGTGYALFAWSRRLGGDSARAAAALAISAALFFRVQDEGRRRRKMLMDTIKAVFTALDHRDPITGGHSTRVSEMSLRLMDRLVLPAQLYEDIHLGALIHDLGKIGIPDSILNKKGPLTGEEYQVIRNHPSIAKSILDSVELPAAAFEAVYQHHERYDGTGYPQGLRGEDISPAGRIVAIADVFDAMTHRRPYREGESPAEVLQMMAKASGSHFDPEFLHVFLTMLSEQTATTPVREGSDHEAA